MELIIYLLIGAIAGFAAGLFGVGGGLIIVPILAGIADYLSGQGLQLLIGCFAIWVAFKMFRGAGVAVDPQRRMPSAPMQLAAGGGIGIASAIFGIGGGSLTVPYLNRHGVVMQKAVATSAACGLPIAVAGALGFMWFGKQADVAVPNTIGYVHIYAFIGISVMSFITAKLGAKVAHMLSPAMLKKCFACLLTAVGSYFMYQGLSQLF